MIQLSILSPIEDLLTWALEEFHTTFGLTWAWSIIVLTLCVRVLLVPLTVRQIHSMQRMQQHLPEMKEIQKRYKADRKKQNEELMKFYRENQINPASSCLPILPQIPIFFALYFVLRHFDDDIYPKYPASALDWLNFVPDITANIGDHWSGYVLLTVYIASQIASTWFMPMATTSTAQRYIFLALPLVFALFIINPPGGATFPVGLLLYWMTTNLWTVGQGIVTRQSALSVTTGPGEALVTDAAQGRASAGGGGRFRRARAEGAPGQAGRASPGEAQEEAGASVNEELRVETEGETVGEAKWAALRELEKLDPAVDKASVRFQVVAEGERGILGVGYSPARVVATVDAESRVEEAVVEDESEPAALIRDLIARTTSALGISCRIEIADNGDTLVATCSGRDLGLLIGRHGQTIDAIQYLCNAILARQGAGISVVVDAAGYRARREATLGSLASSAAEQAVRTGDRVELEPMTAVERKIVHVSLQDHPGVETTSEGTEPNRFVVVLPAA